MKIGDKVFVHGYVDEIRKDIIIIRNEGGYFGTVPDEILPSAQPEVLACGEGELSAQPERTCVNCGRTANNGGWYADGRTRCPIEEHYALPKDGFCHLWEKRNVADDDYPERREDERPES